MEVTTDNLKKLQAPMCRISLHFGIADNKQNQKTFKIQKVVLLARFLLISITIN